MFAMPLKSALVLGIRTEKKEVYRLAPDFKG